MIDTKVLTHSTFSAAYPSYGSTRALDDLRAREYPLLDAGGHDPKRTSLMVDYSHTEFSRIRLQYNRDQSTPVTDTQLILQYVVSIGPHGAHQF